MARTSTSRWTVGAALGAGLLALVACTGTDADTGADVDEGVDVDDAVVSLSAPDGWTRSDPEVRADVLETLRWMPPRDDGSSLQVVVGCGPDTTVEELLEGAAQGERALPVVGGVEEPVAVDVDGLDEARRVTFALGSSPDDVRLWMGGLYGVGDGLLVLVEMVRPHAQFSQSAMDEVLGSVEVDTSDAAERCAATAED